MNLEPADETDPDTDDADAIIPREGWHVIHLFYHVEHTQWSLYSDEEKLEAKTHLAELVQEIRSIESTQLLTFSIVTPKADLGFLLLTEDLHTANELEKRLTAALGPDILTPTYSYLSLTERSDFVKDKEGQLYPTLPDWPVFCFYPMSFRRGEVHNWYELDSENREGLLESLADFTDKRTGSVQSLFTGSIGLDENEWVGSLFAHSTEDIKQFATEIRFDPLVARYLEFGDFYVGLQLPLDELFRRVGL